MRFKFLNIGYLRIIFFGIFFAWISFFPEPVQSIYSEFVKIFLCLFLLTFIFEKRYRKYLFSFRNWPLWLFLLCISSGIFSAINKDIALGTYIHLATVTFLLFYIGKCLYRFDEYRNNINILICIFSNLVVLISFLELIFGKNILYENFITNPFYGRYVGFRLMSTQLNPVILGSYLIATLPFNFYLFRNKPLFLKVIGAVCSLLSIVVAILTFSRGVFLGIIALVAFFLWQTKQRKFFISLTLIFFITIIFCSYQKNDNIKRFGFERMVIGSYDSVISQYRLDRVKMTFKIFKDYPVKGIGFQHFRIRFNEYCDKNNRGRTNYEFMIPDNMYLTFLAETGIIGSLGFFIFIFLLFKRALNQISNLKYEARWTLIILMSSFVGLLVNMASYELFYWFNPHMLFCLIAGFIQGATDSFRANSIYPKN